MINWDSVGSMFGAVSQTRPRSATSMHFSAVEADVSGLVGLYAKLSRMRILSSERVARSADNMVRKILDTYLEPDKTFVELRNMASNRTIGARISVAS